MRSGVLQILVSPTTKRPVKMLFFGSVKRNTAKLGLWKRGSKWLRKFENNEFMLTVRHTRQYARRRNAFWISVSPIQTLSQAAAGNKGKRSLKELARGSQSVVFGLVFDQDRREPNQRKGTRNGSEPQVYRNPTCKKMHI